MSIIGIDPGVTGAIAILRGAETEIHDMPVLDVKGGHDFDRLGIVHLLSGAGAELARSCQTASRDWSRMVHGRKPRWALVSK